MVIKNRKKRKKRNSGTLVMPSSLSFPRHSFAIHCLFTAPYNVFFFQLFILPSTTNAKEKEAGRTERRFCPAGADHR